jgi:hypothetical protein
MSGPAESARARFPIPPFQVYARYVDEDASGWWMKCEECGVAAPSDARGWMGFRMYDPDEDEHPAIGFFCPECAWREFGEGLRAPRRERG